MLTRYFAPIHANIPSIPAIVGGLFVGEFRARISNYTHTKAREVIADPHPFVIRFVVDQELALGLAYA